jgi:hypothetical protein
VISKQHQRTAENVGSRRTAKGSRDPMVKTVVKATCSKQHAIHSRSSPASFWLYAIIVNRDSVSAHQAIVLQHCCRQGDKYPCSFGLQGWQCPPI